MISIGRFDDEPDFINDEGVKWWLVASNIWMVEMPSGEREYLGILNNTIVATGTALDAVALKVELLAYVEDNPPAPEVPDTPDSSHAPSWMKAKPEQPDGTMTE